ncbi:MAG TPA: PEP/pyruvate-binding domain-containing protein [Anaerolineae bacterium]|nr:PEP/pyruvate-binding domain-containing protein [Anaerolineae bacterium]
MEYLLRFDELEGTRIEHSGGKGANLSLLTQRGFPVPAGGVVTAGAYLAFIEPLRGYVRQTVADLPFEDASAMTGATAVMRAKLAELALPEAVEVAVREFVATFPEGQAFSVRSSSTMEDLANAAFAGQHETFLNCVGADEVLTRIKDCYLSLWGARAVSYRQRHGFDHLQASMAVVLQTMVQCEVAGVGFSLNPVTGNLKEAVFDANFGLGESVVSGEGAVDHFVVEKESGEVVDAIIAEKHMKVVSTAQGIEEVEVSGAEAEAPCLSDEQLAELTALLRRVEASYQFPQDIEWGFAEGALYLLQSRPITTIPARWTRDESAERFPNVLTPLSWDFSEKGFHTSLNFSFRLMGNPPYNGKWFAMHGFYIYGNQNAVEVYAQRTPTLPKSIEELRAVMPQIPQQYRWVQELPVRWSRDLDYYLLRIGEFMAEPVDNKDVHELWAFINEIREHATQYFLPNIAISLTHGMMHRLLQYLLMLGVGPEAPRLFAQLLAYCETKTGQINGELFELAQIIRDLPELEALVMEKPSRQIVADNDFHRFPTFESHWRKFLRNHGHREIDLDAYHPTWLEASWVVVDNIRLILQSDMSETPAQKELALKIQMQKAELELWRLLPEDLHPLYDEVIRMARVYTSLDDMEHYQTTRLALPMRRSVRALGALLVAKGVIEEPMDLFFAHLEQLEVAITADNEVGWATLGEQIYAQKEAYEEAKASTPDWVLGESDVEVEAGDYLEGLPGSSGRAQGEVFCVHSTDDFADFPKGAVLVARTTNPTWTPLFYSASAVITESGGPLSHGAVTAREMQIPAVMSVRGALSKFKNGQRVDVDGTAGRVYIVEE